MSQWRVEDQEEIQENIVDCNDEEKVSHSLVVRRYAPRKSIPNDIMSSEWGTLWGGKGGLCCVTSLLVVVAMKILFLQLWSEH